MLLLISILGILATSARDSTLTINRFLLALMFVFPSTFLVQIFSYAPINVPSAVATEARGINNNGEIVGFYKMSLAKITTSRFRAVRQKVSNM
jgi:hypothetical protein